MALFFKKKKEEKKELTFPSITELPKAEIPKFPEFTPSKTQEPGARPGFQRPPEFKTLEIEAIKREIERPPQDLGIPIRKAVPEEKVIVARKPIDETKPIYVKIEKYKAAMDLIDQIKSKIAEAENILAELGHLKESEDKELENWKNDLQQIKDKILSVDKNLFEV